MICAGSLSLAPRQYKGLALSLRETDMKDEPRTIETLLLTQFTLDHAPDAVYWMEPDGRFLYVNETACRTLGYTREELLSMGVRDIDPNLPEGVPPELREATKKAGSSRVETEHRTKDGRIIPVEVMVACIEYKGKEYHCSFVRDITERKRTEESLQKAYDEMEVRVKERTSKLTEEIAERKRAEEEQELLRNQLIQAQKMEAIGTLAGGIAHDFNNIMTVIKNLVSLALNKAAKDPACTCYLEPIRDVSERGINLVQQLLIFSQNKPVVFSCFNLNDVIDDFLKIISTIISEDISIDNKLEQGLWDIKADRGRIEQVITNLIINSRDSMLMGGVITLRTENITLNADRAASIQGAHPGNFICLTVEEDTGKGMDKETIPHIFEPFFTTKAPRGTGLGLSVVYGIVKELGGWINVASQPGRGSKFMVYLPVSTGSDRAAEKEPAERKALHGGGRRILLVEDDKWVRKSTAMVLSESGYTVFEASSAEQAISLFYKEKGRFDLVMSDVVMSGKSGLHMVSPLLDINPSIPILLCSGHLDDKAQLDQIIRRGIAYIQKPYEIDDLLHAIEETIEEDSAGGKR